MILRLVIIVAVLIALVLIFAATKRKTFRRQSDEPDHYAADCIYRDGVGNCIPVGTPQLDSGNCRSLSQQRDCGFHGFCSLW